MTFKKGVNPKNAILIVDDEIHAIKSFELALRSGGLNHIIPCSMSRNVLGIMEREEIDLILLDVIMPELSGDEILSKITERFPDIPVIMVTGINDVDTAVRCMRNGAFDYIVKPISGDRLLPAVHRAIEVSQLRRENARLTQCLFSNGLEQPEIFSRIVTRSSKMQAIFQYCEAVARGRHPILITGETGVGKELIAEAIHQVSGRDGNLVAINVAGLDDNVFSDTLFGHVKGAFTDAVAVRTGQIEKAAGGTLFLDEIGDLSLISQVKLLRLLDKNEYLPLGSDVAKPVNARFLFATHKDLSGLLRQGKFREDLFYRLRTHHLHIPPLRERIDDIPILLAYFIHEAAQEFRKKAPSYREELLKLLQSYHFPGNIREFKAMVFDAVGRHRSRLLSTQSFTSFMKKDHEAAFTPSAPAQPPVKPWLTGRDGFPTLRETANALVEEAMRRAKNNQRVAAFMLGITPQALSQRLKRRS